MLLCLPLKLTEVAKVSTPSKMLNVLERIIDRTYFGSFMFESSFNRWLLKFVDK